MDCEEDGKCRSYDLGSYTEVKYSYIFLKRLFNNLMFQLKMNNQYSHLLIFYNFVSRILYKKEMDLRLSSLMIEIDRFEIDM